MAPFYLLKMQTEILVQGFPAGILTIWNHPLTLSQSECTGPTYFYGIWLFYCQSCTEEWVNKICFLSHCIMVQLNNLPASSVYPRGPKCMQSHYLFCMCALHTRLCHTTVQFKECIRDSALTPRYSFTYVHAEMKNLQHYTQTDMHKK